MHLHRLRSLVALQVSYIWDVMSVVTQNQLLLHLMLTTSSLLCIYSRMISYHITVSRLCISYRIISYGIVSYLTVPYCAVQYGIVDLKW